MNPDEVREDWAEREGEFSPRYYAEKGPDEVSETIRSAIEFYVGTDARVLELGCGSGRHLEHLRRGGFDRLAGVDINDESFDVMGEYFPTLAETGEFHTGAIEDLLPAFDDDEFDAVYSVETLQHVHPDDTWVFEEVVRICGDLLVTAENEGNGARRGREGAEVSYVNDEFPLYHRNWRDVFSGLGGVQVVNEPTKRDTIRAFKLA
ncbi:methyltransferase domain-containing protein [Halobaculum sp. WSA2]|uniref:Methyltransferase domain-containing protein n=1 Tax=Halobaculum saliterrae TaxID=2073113 RepID=A0A6B0SU56_9EURY|nr:class I SAM-dependent methyltransferase [Halobaculum saliterrae]MXR42384.1 methyltransferase domain-containing protein [Halobaculum saliterrae]